MITVAELWTRLDALAAPLPSEQIPLSACLGRILDEHILAPEDQPPFNRSAIDGYLVHAEQPTALVSLVGTLTPGSPPPSAAPAFGTALRILTGSALPPESAALVMQEDTRPGPTSGQIELLQPPSTRHIRPRASQARAGDRLITSGQRLTPGALALLASLGVTHPLVHRRARVAHLVTGGELVAPDATPQPGQIRDSNSTLIAALLAETGAELCWHRRVADSRTTTADALADALASPADIILISGGASVGDHDHTGSLLAEFGFKLHCDKVSSRPGKPFIAASRDRRLAFGLPGNPLAHFVCFHLFVNRVLAYLAGTDPSYLVRAKLDEDACLEGNPRETWWPAYLSYSRNPNRSTSLVVTPLPWRDSSDLTALALADALVRIPAGGTHELAVEVLPCR